MILKTDASASVFLCLSFREKRKSCLRDIKKATVSGFSLSIELLVKSSDHEIKG
jgi:hypothetical protein